MDHTAKIDQVTRLYNKYKIRELAAVQMDQYLETAFSALDNISVSGPGKTEIENLAKSLINREH